MVIARRIFFHTLTQTAGKAVALVIGLLTVSLLARSLGEKGFGEYSTVLALLGFFVTLAELGLHLIVVREIAKGGTDHHSIISNALGLRLVASVLFLLLGVMITLIFPYEQEVKLALLIGSAAFLFNSLAQVLMGVFQKHLVPHLSVLSEAVTRLIYLALVYWFIKTGAGLPLLLGAMGISSMLYFLLTAMFAQRYEKFGLAFDWRVWQKILKESWPLAFAVILNLVYFKTDTIILSLFHPGQAVGVYSLPYKILEVLLAFPAMFVGLIMPFLSREAFGNWDKFRNVFGKALDALILLGIPMVITTQYFAGNIIDLVRGQEQYLDSPNLLKILILSAAVIFCGTLFGYSVVAVGRQKQMIKGYLAGAVIGLALYLALIPRFSYWGAAWSTLVAEIVVAGFAYFLVRQESGIKFNFALLLRALPATAGLVLFLQTQNLFWMAEFILGLGLYALLLFIFRAVPLDFARDLLRLKSLDK